MILAADIGATKTRLGLFLERGAAPVSSETYRTAAFGHPADMVEAFLASQHVRPTRACLGVAAPPTGRRVQSVKLPWIVDATELERRLHLDEVLIVNDVEANARAIAALDERDLAVLNAGAADAVGTRAVVSAGTGLGEAALWWDGTAHRAGQARADRRRSHLGPSWRWSSTASSRPKRDA